MAGEKNVCAGPFGAVYDFYIERPRFARVVLRLMWGVDLRPFYRSLAAVSELDPGATVLDVPCGGGVALRGLAPGQRVRWVAVDLEEAMLARIRRRAAAHTGVELEALRADMTDLPLADGSADLCLTYGGLHCVGDPLRALCEMARCLRPGGRLAGSTFLSAGSRRQRMLLRNDDFGVTGSAGELRRWLAAAGFVEVEVDRDHGLAVFCARRAPAA